MERSENFDEFMKAVGVGLVIRRLAKRRLAEPRHHADREEVHYQNHSTFKTTEISFKLGEEFKETTAVGRVVKSTISMEDESTLIDKKGNDRFRSQSFNFHQRPITGQH